MIIIAGIGTRQGSKRGSYTLCVYALVLLPTHLRCIWQFGEPSSQDKYTMMKSTLIGWLVVTMEVLRNFDESTA
jgi:hypothetical protein